MQEKSLRNNHLTDREQGIYVPDGIAFILYGMVLLLTLPLQEMMIRPRGLCYSVDAVPISWADRIYDDSKFGKDHGSMLKGCSASGSRYREPIINLPQPSPFFQKF